MTRRSVWGYRRGGEGCLEEMGRGVRGGVWRGGRGFWGPGGGGGDGEGVRGGVWRGQGRGFGGEGCLEEMGRGLGGVSGGGGRGFWGRGGGRRWGGG